MTQELARQFLGRVEAAWARRDLGSRLAALCHDAVAIHSPWGTWDEAGTAEVAILPLALSVDPASLTGEDVFWSAGAPDLVVPRLVMQGRHSGDGFLDAASHRPVQLRIAAEAYVADGRLSEVYVVADTGALVSQCGMEVRDWARGFAGRAAVDVPAPPRTQGNGSPWGEAWADLVHDLLCGDTAAAAQFDPACHGLWPSGGQQFGPYETQRAWAGLRAAFPSARITIQHAIGVEEPLMPPRASVRWTLRGKHDGWGAFGPPSGAPVVVSGLSQAEFGPDGVRHEVTLFDAVALWSQIHAHSGAFSA